MTNSATVKENEYFKSAKRQLKNWRPLKTANKDHQAQVIDLFCGAGGVSLGFAALAKAQGYFKVIGGADINKISLSTFSHNFKVPSIEDDVQNIAKSRRNLNAFLNQLDGYDSRKKTVLVGCPPCQGFSAHRKKNWDTPDQRNGLVESFADIAAMLQPDCIIIENVPEFLSGRYWQHFEYFRDKMQKSGYIVKQAIHNAAAQGVPQERFRAIVMAMKQDFSLPQDKLTRAKFKTVKSAIAKLPIVKAGEKLNQDPMHKSATHRQSTLDIIKTVPKDGGTRRRCLEPNGLKTNKGFSDVYGRLSWSKPAITITHYARNPASGRFVHPEQDRGLTAREAARLQSFPDGYEFKGSFDDVFRQIGEAVPPLLSLSIAAATLANMRQEYSQIEQDLVLQPVNNSFASAIVGIKYAKIYRED